MTVKLLPQSDERQMNPLKSSQQRFGRGTLRPAFGITRIQPCQVFLLVSQPLAYLELQQGQDAQADGEQAHQTGRALVTLHIHRREGKRFTFQSSKAVLHQVFFAVRQDRLREREPLGGVIGDIHPPSQARRENPVPILYVDGHRKPVYADSLIPRGLIGRTGKVLGCRALVIVHDHQGHPLLVTTHRGDQHLTMGLPAILTYYEQAADLENLKRIVVDREGMAAEFLAQLSR
jgi:hypothetical protein